MTNTSGQQGMRKKSFRKPKSWLGRQPTMNKRGKTSQKLNPTRTLHQRTLGGVVAGRS